MAMEHISDLFLILPAFTSYKPTVTTFKYVKGGPDREAPEVVWNTNSYI